MRIATQIAKDLGGAAKGPLGVDDPLAAIQRIQQLLKCMGIVEVRDAASERQLPHLIHRLQGCQELAAEQLAQHFHGQEILASAGDPTLAVERQTAAGDDTVQMRMKAQLLSPGVQDRRDADLRAQAMGIDAQRQKRRRRGLEQKLVQPPLVMQDKRLQDSG